VLDCSSSLWPCSGLSKNDGIDSSGEESRSTTCSRPSQSERRRGA
jgi:hypothetical protein